MSQKLFVFGALIGFAGAALAVPAATPLYTFCEAEDNDLCVDSQLLDANIAATYAGTEDGRDCFFVTGKLQEDCVWGFQPKCAIRAYGKPLQCYDSNRVAIPGEFYEPLLASSDSQGRILNLAPGVGDRTIRLAIAATLDALDGTVNGLNQNGAHTETGEVTVKIVYDGIDDGPFRGDEPDDSYVFRFGGPSNSLGAGQNLRGGPAPRIGEHSDAARVAFVIPPGVGTVDIYCCDDTGTQEVCYDVDFYTVTNLIPNRSYCLTMVGGLDEFCEKPNFALGWFDKQWQLLQCETVRAKSNDRQEKVFSSDEVAVIPDQVDGVPGSITRSIFVDSEGPIERIQLNMNIFHDYVGDLIVELHHVESDTTATIFDRPGRTDSGFGFASNLDGDYSFSSDGVDSFETAAASNPVPNGLYRGEGDLGQFLGFNKYGEWQIRISDNAGSDRGVLFSWSLAILNGEEEPEIELPSELCILSDGEGVIRFGVSAGVDLRRGIPNGDCNFNGLTDSAEEIYNFTRFLLDIRGLVPSGYRPGASTKDATADEVTRYPRAVWDDEEYSEFFGGGRRIAPEVVFSHGLCAEYCIKIRLAEHVDPSERPTAPTVVSAHMADLNTDDVVNAQDLALLLSFWGAVPAQ